VFSDRFTIENETILLFAARTHPWNPPVLTCIAVEKTGILEIWQIIADHRKMLSKTGGL